jgi:CRP-like cAMP-binding protein
MPATKANAREIAALLRSPGDGRAIRSYAPGAAINLQGDPAESLFYILAGTVQVSAVSGDGKEVILGLLREGEFFGQRCLLDPPASTYNVTALGKATVVTITRAAASKLLASNPRFAQAFLSCVLRQWVTTEEEIVDHLLNTSERRLARLLLLLANIAPTEKEAVLGQEITQGLLARRVGTTRSRVNYFMNKFKRLGYIQYNGTVTVRRALAEVLTVQPPQSRSSRSA